jgi:hypothetical protein
MANEKKEYKICSYRTSSKNECTYTLDTLIHDTDKHNAKHLYTVFTEEEPTIMEIHAIGQISIFIPYYKSKNQWLKLFETFKTEQYDNNLINLIVNGHNKNGHTMLAIAVLDRELFAVKELLGMGADINLRDTLARSGGATPIYHAIGRTKTDSAEDADKSKQILELLLQNNADTKIRHIKYKSPLEYAHKEEFPEAASIIENFEAKKETPLQNEGPFAQNETNLRNSQEKIRC